MAGTVAIAFHSSISGAKIDELFGNPDTRTVPARSFAHCPTCKQLYGVYLSDKDDPGNFSYVCAIEEALKGECKGGNHRLEFTVER